MNPSLYRSAMEGKVDVLRQHIHVIKSEVTKNHNTVLHVAAQFGHLQYVVGVLEACPSLLHRANTKGDTPLHMAAREGQAEIVEALIFRAKTLEQESISSWGGAVKRMLRATNVDKDTALHMATRNCHLEEVKYLEVVKLLTKEDPQFQHSPNNAEETPLYLAAERGNKGVMFALLETCTWLAYSGPEGRTTLHVAALKDSTGESTKKLLEWKKDLINQMDVYGWTALHYAACNGSEKGVKELLAVDRSGVYITSKTECTIVSRRGVSSESSFPNDGLGTPLHIAAAYGHISVIEALLSYSPDCWEVVDGNGQNVLHIAVDMNMESVIKFLVNQSWVRHLINQKDNQGNTPLHLLIASDCKVDELWKHRSADRHAFNGKNMTPVDLVWSDFKGARMSTFAATYIMVTTSAFSHCINISISL
ncbi:hypothetical protein Vadar_008527 [Vaccinium darrowii]|uniref:Uncharacterized protein n=1 Tax=Vaccinium darrowii TaxID=229202 RepID=A0ACB7X8K1_9ERIC|nr:hypothetical protein Vadar_008527 [Vaccinium darrowii]